MSTTENAARVLKSVKDEEWRTLAGLERSTSGSGTPDLGRLSRMARLPRERVRFATDELEKKGLIMRKGHGYALTKEGVEVMALKDYVKKDLIFALGAAIAKGKESDVYEALTEEGTAYALKFYKIGRVSFTSIRKTRVREVADFRSWMTANYDAARREYDALRKLQGLSPCFPKAIAYSRSTVLLEELSGVRLSNRPYLENPRSALLTIIEAMRIAFVRAELVNADLSEYNILSDGAAVWLIDWPQAVGASHPNGSDLLTHDVKAVLSFFRRAYDVGLDQDATFAYVTGKADQLE
jgi:RIO-like serine/threonine protein kinase